MREKALGNRTKPFCCSDLSGAIFVSNFVPPVIQTVLSKPPENQPFVSVGVACVVDRQHSGELVIRTLDFSLSACSLLRSGQLSSFACLLFLAWSPGPRRGVFCPADQTHRLSLRPLSQLVIGIIQGSRVLRSSLLPLQRSVREYLRGRITKVFRTKEVCILPVPLVLPPTRRMLRFIMSTLLVDGSQLLVGSGYSLRTPLAPMTLSTGVDRILAAALTTTRLRM